MRTKTELRKLLIILKKRKEEVTNDIADKNLRTIPLALLDTQIYSIQWVLETKNISVHWNYCTGCGILHENAACPKCNGFVYKAWDNKL